MPSKEFIVKVVTTDAYDQWALSLENVQNVIVSAVGYADRTYVDSVREFNQNDYAITRTGKITAIKKVRELLSCSLLEAKVLVDAAGTRTGTTKVFGVVIDYDSLFEPSAYHVKKA